ncbi:MAG: superoxide dismutase, Ni [Gammaproteobacteria bacterium]|nr:superoxide dismutase, Ni [Gammaproteobacteria bacterium]
MLHALFQRISKTMPIPEALAHCDIPCKIYDPITAQLAALSVIRFLDLIDELQQKESLSFSDQAQLMRLVSEKETHAAKVKDEVRVIWGDFFKQPQLDKMPDTHELVHKIMLAASACKQNVSRENGESLLKLVNQFAEYFWRAKDVETYRATCPYPPGEKLVYPLLKSES